MLQPAAATATTGLLLDVDGPLASPVTRRVPARIIADLLTLASAGWPIVFNTGRSDAFIRSEVMSPMRSAGIPAGVEFHAICEKGAVWFTFSQDQYSAVQVDDRLAVPASYADSIRNLVASKYADLMFFDETKRAMVSVEQNLDVASEDYRAAQGAFDADALDLMRSHDLGVCWLDRKEPASDGGISFRIDPTIISTDIEAVGVGKDLGAERALTLLRAHGPVPSRWRTVGDSRTDYAMADYLHAEGFAVAHVDVRPGDGVPAKPYQVLPVGQLVNDDAGAAFLAACVASLSGFSQPGERKTPRSEDRGVTDESAHP